MITILSVCVIILAAVLYLAMAKLSHYEGLLLGSAIPPWLCVFCLIERVKVRYDG